MNLCWKLSLVEHGFSSPALLSNYDEERLPVIKDMLGITTIAYNQIYNGIGAAHRDKFLELRQFGVNYRWSSIVSDDKPSQKKVGTYGASSDEIHAGDRAPDASGLVNIKTGSVNTIYQYIKSSRHTVLLFASFIDEVVPFLDVLEKTPTNTFQSVVILDSCKDVDNAPTKGMAINVLVDSDNNARKSYNCYKDKRIIIIRPDGIIGALTSSISGIQKYLGFIFI